MQEHSEVKNQVVQFNDDLHVLNYKSFNSDSGRYKIIFTGNMGCTPCVIRLKKIQSFFDLNKNSLNDIQIVYIGSGEKNEYFDFQVNKNKFTFPILIDENSTFITNNNLINYERSVLLLDEDNKIVLIGSPLNDKKVNYFYNHFLKINEKL